jgi:hypothetical protein
MNCGTYHTVPELINLTDLTVTVPTELYACTARTGTLYR